MAAEQAANLVGTLTIVVHEAQDLHDAQLVGKQDPYVVVKIGKTTKKTRVHNDAGVNASWEESFVYQLTGKEGAVEITVNDKELISDNHIGSAKLALSELRINDTPLWFTLTRSNGKDGGRLKLTFKFKGTIAGKPYDSATVAAAESKESKAAVAAAAAVAAPVVAAVPQVQYVQQPQQAYYQQPAQPAVYAMPVYQQGYPQAAAAPVYQAVYQPAAAAAAGPVYYQAAPQQQPAMYAQPVAYGQPMAQPVQYAAAAPAPQPVAQQPSVYSQYPGNFQRK